MFGSYVGRCRRAAPSANGTALGFWERSPSRFLEERPPGRDLKPTGCPLDPHLQAPALLPACGQGESRRHFHLQRLLEPMGLFLWTVSTSKSVSSSPTHKQPFLQKGDAFKPRPPMWVTLPQQLPTALTGSCLSSTSSSSSSLCPPRPRSPIQFCSAWGDPDEDTATLLGHDV